MVMCKQKVNNRDKSLKEPIMYRYKADSSLLFLLIHIINHRLHKKYTIILLNISTIYKNIKGEVSICE